MSELRKVDTSRSDAMVARMLADPDAYFTEQRKAAWKRVLAERSSKSRWRGDPYVRELERQVALLVRENKALRAQVGQPKQP